LLARHRSSDPQKTLSGVYGIGGVPWNTKIAKHYFCSICGIYTHHQRRSVPTEYGFNLACIEGIDLSAIGNIGASNGAMQTLVSPEP